MFEKDLYALINGLRNHKNNEKEYIENSIKECRKEIKGSDMDQKATALLKLVYLEMFGHDMSWASFNVLEVMSSAKYLQKRVGYLAAVQSFRPDTEVLMLGENLLKKDLMSPHIVTIALALQTIPHVINPPMANSLLADLLPRLSHSNHGVRKKTIVTLYRLALVFPETLRPAWPKIKERLLDENEDPSVTAAIVNVICELGWRRPQDFLPLAPRLFELLVNGGNNWMAIKIIKLFAVLTPLEPRLIRKLLPPLTSLIKTTPAMSLLYECINGIIQGGILDGSEGTVEGDEVARLCVSKLRGMLVVEGDPNLKYVALLAMARIVGSHPALVSQHADVILECIDDPDISIRARALDLVAGMVDPLNLVPTVERLLRQLRESNPVEDAPNDQAGDDYDEEEAQESLRRHEVRSSQLPPLPDDYRVGVIRKILDLCSRDTYANVSDFDWYVGVLVELVKHCPSSDAASAAVDNNNHSDAAAIAESIGLELQNIAVRVKAIRPEVTAAAQSLLLIERRRDLFPSAGTTAYAVLGPVAWIAGEFAQSLPDPDGTLAALTHPSSSALPPHVLVMFLQAIPKVFVRLVSNTRTRWTTQRQAHTTLLTARLIHFLEPLALHPDLDVQERAVEYLELLRLASEASSASPASADGMDSEAPLVLTQALPALFSGQELNPVAPTAIHKVPIDSALDLSAPINPNLQTILSEADYDTEADPHDDEIYRLYHEKPATRPSPTATTAAAETIPSDPSTTYQNLPTSGPLDAAELSRLKASRKERYQNDPFYIDPDRGSGTSTPVHSILRQANGDTLDIDAIPVMELQLDDDPAPAAKKQQRGAAKPKPRRRVEIAADETLDGDGVGAATTPPSRARSALGSRDASAVRGRNPLEVDSSRLARLSLGEHGEGAEGGVERREREEREMMAAVREVERARLEMQRERERVVDTAEVVVVRRKKKRRDGEAVLPGVEECGEGKVKRKKKKKAKGDEGLGQLEGEAAVNGSEKDGVATSLPPAEEGEVKVKKKKKRVVVLDGGEA